MKRVSLGFDLRIKPELQTEDLPPKDQRLVPRLHSPISADPAIWLWPEGVDLFHDGILPDFANPLHLAKDINLLLAAYEKRGISEASWSRVCLTTSETNIVALVGRFGLGHFEDRPTEETLLSDEWQLRGFDVVDLDGLISGLKGCGYSEPTWSKLRYLFGSALNEFGLFGDCSSAAEFAEVRGLQIKVHAPFVVVGVLTYGDPRNDGVERASTCGQAVRNPDRRD
jgi:hypothetical protein